MIGVEGESAAKDVEQPFELGHRQVRRCAAADEQGVDFVLLSPHFPLEGGQIGFHEIVSTGDDGEVAIPAMMGTKGDMDIGCARDEGYQLINSRMLLLDRGR